MEKFLDKIVAEFGRVQKFKDSDVIYMLLVPVYIRHYFIIKEKPRKLSSRTHMAVLNTLISYTGTSANERVLRCILYQ